MTYTNFQMFLKISLAVMVEIVHLALSDVIESFNTYTMNSLLVKKFETNSIMSKALYRVAKPKKILLLLTEALGQVNHFFNKRSSFWTWIFIQNFHFYDVFLKVWWRASIVYRQISRSITSLRTKKTIAKVKILNKGLYSKKVFFIESMIYVTQNFLQ